jgi:glutathione S-transferase
VSFQKRMLKTSEFLALSRWGQVPVLVDSGRIYTQTAAIVEHLAETLVRFQGRDLATARLFGNGCTGMSMPCFRQSLTAMRFSLANDNFFQSLSSL